VLIKFTYYGDADFNGKIDSNDYSHIDFGFNHAGSTGWANGDFNTTAQSTAATTRCSTALQPSGRCCAQRNRRSR